MSRKLSRNSRRAIVASLLGLTVGGGVLASAASLGVTGNTLGAGTVVIASCDDNVILKYTHTYVAGVPAVNPGSYRTSAVTISGIAPACVGKRLDITLKDSLGASLASGFVGAIAAATPVTADSTVTVTFLTSPFADANAVVGAAVVIAD